MRKLAAVPVGGRERRVDVRTAATLPAAFVPFHESKRGFWKATVLDFSSGGFRLQVSELYPLGTVLEVIPRGSTVGSLVQVRWAGRPVGSAFRHDAGQPVVVPLGQPAIVDVTLRRPGSTAASVKRSVRVAARTELEVTLPGP